ncbi:uncharacterized protein METZ01_LOCUS492231, partial [marine metagenome]
MKQNLIIIVFILINFSISLQATEFVNGNLIAKFNSDIHINDFKIILKKDGIFIERILFKELNI